MANAKRVHRPGPHAQPVTYRVVSPRLTFAEPGDVISKVPPGVSLEALLIAGSVAVIPPNVEEEE